MSDKRMEFFEWKQAYLAALTTRGPHDAARLADESIKIFHDRTRGTPGSPYRSEPMAAETIRPREDREHLLAMASIVESLCERFGCGADSLLKAVELRLSSANALPFETRDKIQRLAMRAHQGRSNPWADSYEANFCQILDTDPVCRDLARALRPDVVLRLLGVVS